MQLGDVNKIFSSLKCIIVLLCLFGLCNKAVKVTPHSCGWQKQIAMGGGSKVS